MTIIIIYNNKYNNTIIIIYNNNYNNNNNNHNHNLVLQLCLLIAFDNTKTYQKAKLQYQIEGRIRICQTPQQYTQSFGGYVGNGDVDNARRNKVVCGKMRERKSAGECRKETVLGLGA